MSDRLTDVTCILPIRTFDGMTRLAPVLTPGQRRTLSMRLAERALLAVGRSGLTPMVVTTSPEVWKWAMRRNAAVCDDPGSGLSAAAAAGVSASGANPWIVCHADLPLITSRALIGVARAGLDGIVLVPSHDGGTNVIAGFGRFDFQYGPGSFHRHFAAHPTATVLPIPELSIDIDRREQLEAFGDLVASL